MRILVTGAYGLIGSACLARLHAAGHDLVAAGRAAAPRRRFAYAHWVTADFARLTKPELWLPLLAGIDAVVNCVGALQDGARDNVQRVQFDGTVALFEACVQAEVKRLVHISAIGAEPEGPSAFSRSKAAAEARLKTLALEWVIVRPGLVLGPAAHGGSALLRGLAAFPLCLPLVGADAPIQIVDIDDVAETVARAIAPAAPAKAVWDVAHPQVHTLADIVRAMRAWLGFRPRRAVRLPRAPATVLAWLGDAAGWLGWRSPVSSTGLLQLEAGVVGDPHDWMAATGIEPRSLDALLTARPAGVQDRWFARLYLLKPLAIFGLAVATAASGVLAIIASVQRSGTFGPFEPEVMPGFMWGAIAIILALCLTVRATVRGALIVLIVLTFGHAASSPLSGSAYALVPLATDIPPLLAMLLTLAILDER